MHSVGHTSYLDHSNIDPFLQVTISMNKFLKFSSAFSIKVYQPFLQICDIAYLQFNRLVFSALPMQLHF